MTRVQLTYVMQMASVVLGTSAVGFGEAAYLRGQIWLVVFNVVLLVVNVGLFFVQWHVRKMLRFIKRGEEITLQGVNGENGER